MVRSYGCLCLLRLSLELTPEMHDDNPGDDLKQFVFCIDSSKLCGDRLNSFSFGGPLAARPEQEETSAENPPILLITSLPGLSTL